MPKTLLSILCLLLGTTLEAQTTFHKKYNNNQSHTFFFGNICARSDGGYLVTGAREVGDGPPLLALADDGHILWQKSYRPFDGFGATVEVPDGFIIRGFYQIPNPVTTYVTTATLLKVTKTGSVVWAKKFEGSQAFSDFSDLVSAPNGVIFSGLRWNNTVPQQSQSVLIRLDNNGNTLWSKYYDNPLINNTFQAKLIQGDTIYACGNIRGNGCFIRINLNTGNLIDYTALGGLYSDNFTSLEPTSDGNFLMAGTTFSTTDAEAERPWVVKVSRTGQIIWSKTYNFPGLNTNCSMARSASGGFVLSVVNGLLAINEDGLPLWAKDYSGGQPITFFNLTDTPDLGFAAVGIGGGFHTGVVLKTDSLGNVANTCCPETVNFTVEDYYPPTFNYSFATVDWTNGIAMSGVVDSTEFTESDYCQAQLTSLTINKEICTEDSIEINGHFYHAPATIRDTLASINGSCDTVRVYNLSLIPQPFTVKTIRFCPGSSVNIGGVTYTHPGTVTQIIPAVTGCDTLLAYLLQYLPYPSRQDTIRFCQGDTVWLHGSPHVQPEFVEDTIPGIGAECDTIVHYWLNWLNYSPSIVTAKCPDAITRLTATAAAVTYDPVTAVSDCPCPGMFIHLEQGLPSGVTFPLGTTNVCYSATDACYHSASCCFQVTLTTPPPTADDSCDTKEIGCLKFELLSVKTDAEQNHSYRIRVTNNCPNPLVYNAIELPNAVVGIAPNQALPYVSSDGRIYDVRNPSLSPFRCIRYKSVGNGIANGQSDIFEYTLPPQSNPTFIRVGASLAPHIFYQTTLNTFGCNVNQNRSEKAETVEQADTPLLLFPNPTTGEIWLDLTTWPAQALDLTLRNGQGEILPSLASVEGGGLQVVTLPSALPNGLYWITVAAKNGLRKSVKLSLIR